MDKIIKHINSLDIEKQDKIQIATELLLELEPDLQEQIIEFSLFSKLSDKN